MIRIELDNDEMLNDPIETVSEAISISQQKLPKKGFEKIVCNKFAYDGLINDLIKFEKSQAELQWKADNVHDFLHGKKSPPESDVEVKDLWTDDDGNPIMSGTLWGIPLEYDCTVKNSYLETK